MKTRLIPYIVIAALVGCLLTTASWAAKPKLTFSSAGKFRIVQFSDTQDGPNLNPRTATAMGKILDTQRPDFVVITGDCVDTGRCANVAELRKAIDAIAQPMESRRIPWAVTFGNHDRDNIGKIGISQTDMLGIYIKYPYNLNAQSPKGVHGAGNSNLLINSRSTGKAAFGIWLIDSNAYAPAEIAGQKMGGYDRIRTSQVRWYWDSSVALEKRHGRKIPSLMFFHIALPEFKDMLAAGKFTGESNEDVSSSLINGGLFAAALERGDVLGIFVGHDHVNTAVGDRYGIRLGYGGNIGYATYGVGGEGDAPHRLRGAQVFDLAEGELSKFTVRYVTAASLASK